MSFRYNIYNFIVNQLEKIINKYKNRIKEFEKKQKKLQDEQIREYLESSENLKELYRKYSTEIGRKLDNISTIDYQDLSLWDSIYNKLDKILFEKIGEYIKFYNANNGDILPDFTDLKLVHVGYDYISVDLIYDYLLKDNNLEATRRIYIPVEFFTEFNYIKTDKAPEVLRKMLVKYHMVKKEKQ